VADIRALLEHARHTLAKSVDAPQLEAEILLAHVLGRDRSWLYAWPEHVPDAGQCKAFEQLVERRAQGQPVGHLTGEREFWSLRLAVNEHTLIPRPESELLVETALALELPTEARVLELGTGSGAIALALASERPRWRLSALDCSPEALAIARANAVRLGLNGIRFIHSHWFDALPAQQRYDLIVANPPYVAQDDPHLARGDLRFEPRAALVSGVDGLDDIRQIIAAAPGHLRPSGWLWLEHGCDQGARVAALLRGHGYHAVVTRRDPAGHDRISGGQWPSGEAADAGSG